MFNNTIFQQSPETQELAEKFPEFDYNSFYRAIVSSIEDPENLGRIKVKIPALHHDTADINLPYAWPGIFAGFGNQVGQFILPPVGSIVFVTFEYSDEHRLIYFGGVPTLYADNKKQYYGKRINDGESKLITERDLATEYTGSQYIIYKSPSGAIIYIDDNDMGPKIVIKDSTGQQIVMASNDIDDENYGGALILKHNDDNLIKISDDSVIIRVNGVDYNVPWGGEQGTSNYRDLENKPKLNTNNSLSQEVKDNEEINGTLKLHKVSKTGNYSDLNGLPTIPSEQVNSDWNAVSGKAEILNKPVLSKVATSNSYADLDDLPIFATVATSGDYRDLNHKPLLSAVATSGSYNDLLNKPDLSTVATSGSYNDLTNKPNLSNVATSGSYNDLTNKPDLTVYEQKSNKVNISSSSTTDQYPNAKSVYDFVCDSLASLPQGLKIPISILSESDLPQEAEDGDYYFIQNMDISADGHTGRAWWNNNQWYKVIDQYQSMDGVSIVQSGGGSWKVSTEWLHSVLPSQEQSDWNVTDTTSPAYIKNKPDLSQVGKQSDWNQSDSTEVDYIKNKPSLSTVATSGSYNDLVDKPVIPTSADEVRVQSTQPLDNNWDIWINPDNIPDAITEVVNSMEGYEMNKAPSVRAIKSQGYITEVTSNDVTNALGYTPLDSSEKGAPLGIAELDANGLLVSSQLPSYIDDVEEFPSRAQFPSIGETGKIYIDTATNITYRWSGSTYVPIGSDLALGETSSTAYRGDRGKIAYDHSQLEHAPSNAEANLIDSIQLNGETLPISNKVVNISVPKASATLWNSYAFVRRDGVTEIGKFIDFHTDDTTGYDFDTRLASVGHNKNTVALPTRTGVLALTSDIPTNVSDFSNDANYVTSSDNSVQNIVSISYEDYKQLEANNMIDPDTEYHILDAASSLDQLQETLDDLQDQINDLKVRKSNPIMRRSQNDQIGWTEVNKWAQMPFNNLLSQDTEFSSWSYENGIVTVGDNASRLRINSTVVVNHNSWVMYGLFVNDTQICKTICGGAGSTLWYTLHLDKIIDVNSGDTISLKVYKDSSGTATLDPLITTAFKEGSCIQLEIEILE